MDWVSTEAMAIIIIMADESDERGLCAELFYSSLLLSSLELSDTKVYEPEIRDRLGTAEP